MCFSAKVETDLKKLSKQFNAQINENSLANFEKLAAENQQKYRFAHEEDQRIYAKNWCPIICNVRGQNEIRIMRYQLLPHFCKEEKYTRFDEETGKTREINSTYNARLDSLMKARAWQKPFMRYHALLPIKTFFEWVPRNGHKAIVGFSPKDRDYLLTPCLYDNWYSEDKSKIIQSFAIITDDPRPEVLEVGHDRTPISIAHRNIDHWLSPQNHEMDSIIDILKNADHDHYDFNWLT